MSDPDKKLIFYCNKCRGIPSIRLQTPSKVKIDCDNCQEKNVYELTVKEFLEKSKQSQFFPNCEIQNRHTKSKAKSQSYCVQCQKWMCAECLSLHNDFNSNHSILKNGIQMTETCEEDNCKTGGKIFYFCLTCKKNICGFCKYNHNTTHTIIDINELFNETLYKEYSKSLQEIKDKLGEVKEIKNKLLNRMRNGIQQIEELHKRSEDINNNLIQFLSILLNTYSNTKSILNFNVNNNLAENKIYFTKSNFYQRIEGLENCLRNTVNFFKDEFILSCNYSNYSSIKATYNVTSTTEKTQIVSMFFGELNNDKLVIEIDGKQISGESSLIFETKGEHIAKIIAYEPITDMSNMFFGCSNLISVDGSRWQTNEVENMSSMFYGCFSLKSIECSNWDTSKVENFERMFFNCCSLKSIDTSNWNFSNCTNMEGMFSFCSALKKLSTSNWNTSFVENFSGLFHGCSSLLEVDVSGWNTSNCVDMSKMFFKCSVLKEINVGNWDTSQVFDMKYMFFSCMAITSIDVSNWDTKQCEDMTCMFSGCCNLEGADICNWNVKKVRDFSGMFLDCHCLKLVDITSWDFSSAEKYFDMFAGCTKLKTLLDPELFDSEKVNIDVVKELISLIASSKLDFN